MRALASDATYIAKYMRMDLPKMSDQETMNSGTHFLTLEVFINPSLCYLDQLPTGIEALFAM